MNRPASGPAADPAASPANPHPSASPAAADRPAPSAAEILRVAPDLIETMRLEQGRVALWPGHRARLRTSALILGYPLDAAALDGWLAERIRGLTDGAPQRLRLLLAADGRLSLESAPLPPTPEPARIALAADVLGPDAVLDAGDPWLRHKTTHRPRFAAAQAWLQAHPEYFDLIFCNTAGNVCEGSRSTIYVQDTAGAWLTPPLDSGLLPGVRRQALLDEGAVREARLSLADLRQAPALRVSNALRGWMRSDMK
ncbi:Para-aminobenzoate synthase, component I OS=Castellaniella defragrans (strain DSM / CCUG 39792/ 65Phen) OX=1437824 GN=BN940_14706 PE=4 SV=1 [Castellaniella denitrificans]|uniref:aminotransferase class IV n=1 Tax=Castellaniella denitrificans TaxID=56119 RepID=UPI00361CBB61